MEPSQGTGEMTELFRCLAGSLPCTSDFRTFSLICIYTDTVVYKAFKMVQIFVSQESGMKLLSKIHKNTYTFIARHQTMV